MEEKRGKDELCYCAKCVTEDEILRNLISQDADVGICAQCGKRRKVITIEDLAAIVDKTYSQYARETDAVPELDGDGVQWVDGGSSPLHILQEDLEIQYDVAESLLEYLSENYGRDQHHDPGPELYDDASEAFILRVPPNDQPQYEWDSFVENVRHHGRFFNENAREYLDKLFDPVLRGDLHKGIAPITTLGPGAAFEHIYRGRIATTDLEQRRIYENPHRELAVPPEPLRRANRMNAEGVAAFYGALDRRTCLAELRPYVHSKVIVGTFRVLQSLRILDMRLVDNALGKLSWFDPDFPERVAQRDFVRNLHELIRRPVIPGTESMEYLPTQFIAEYLSSRGLDGVLYISSLITRAPREDEDGNPTEAPMEDRGLNVVLFAKSSASMNDRDSSRRIVSQLYEVGDRQIVERGSVTDGPPAAYPLVGDAIEPTLELVDDSLRIFEVSAIKYKANRKQVEFTSERAKASDLPF